MTQKANLLLVDDDANTLASLSRAFRMAGHEATVCDNAARASELLKIEKFDLIFSDVVMPGKSGLESLQEIRNAGVRTPLILISGQANIEMAVKATKLGALIFWKSRSRQTNCSSQSRTRCAFRGLNQKIAI